MLFRKIEVKRSVTLKIFDFQSVIWGKYVFSIKFRLNPLMLLNAQIFISLISVFYCPETSRFRVL